MKRKALLIGYSGWDLHEKYTLGGVSLDLKKYKSYLKSSNGGAWNEDEIETVADKNLVTLEANLDRIRQEKNDIVFSVFTGHGGYDPFENHCRYLEIAQNKTILEREILGLSPKQIFICDCCSALIKEDQKSELLFEQKMLDSVDHKKLLARQKYNEIVEKCPEQTIRLYAAAPGYIANDTENGGLYSSCLLDVLKNASENMNIVAAHDLASKRVAEKSLIDSTLRLQETGKLVPRFHSNEFLPGAVIV